MKNGDRIDLDDVGIVGVSGSHKLVGFKPGPPKSPEGWLVFLVNDSKKGQPHKRRKP
ncbi:MAG TPA: hypothetical protein VK474_08995 [Chthoniobacterales bacterium]|nr:hypothetical protein [Chthoniobacterales bacterium]